MLAERSFLTPKILSLNPVSGILEQLFVSTLLIKSLKLGKEMRPGMAPTSFLEMQFYDFKLLSCVLVRSFTSFQTNSDLSLKYELNRNRRSP